MTIRQSLNDNKNNKTSQQTSKSNVGRVQAIILDENTPSNEIFEKYGGWGGVGTILYSDYTSAGTVYKITPDLIDQDLLKSAKPLIPNIKNYPLLGELVYIIDNLPNPISVTEVTPSDKYYLSVINIWNTTQNNSQFTNDEIVLGKYFKQLDIASLKPFEGDIIYESRVGSSIRFGSSNPGFDNFWNVSSKNGEPIVILSNGHKSSNPLDGYVEDINNDASTILLTKSQKIPIDITFSPNPLTNTTIPKNYLGNSQIILNSDKIILNAKNNDILIHSNNNIELYNNNDISFNSNRTLINSKTIILGQNGGSNQEPSDWVMLGKETEKWLNQLLKYLSQFSTSLSSAASTPAGAPIITVNTAASTLNSNIQNLTKKLNKLRSSKVFISK